MKITKIETFQVLPRWCFVKVEVNNGLFGWGEPVIEGRVRTIKAAVSELAEYLIGKCPLRIEDHWNKLYRSGFYRGGPILMSALAGIDQALWDIKGKYYNAPVHELMGGRCRDKIQVYSWIGGDRPSEIKENALKVKENGFKALKMNATEELQYIDSFEQIDALVERLSIVRDVVGNDVKIGLDFHGRVHKPMVKSIIKEIEQFNLMFIEEPVIPENNEHLKEISQFTSIPIATGERMYSRWDFKKILSEGYVDIIQPDLSHAGGITECKKIASMAEAYDIAFAPHCPLGPIALASCLQVDATSHNAVIQEQSLGIHYNQGYDLLDYIDNKKVFNFTDGYVNIPEGVGLGVSINEDKVREVSERSEDWRNPVWRHKDGSIAEW